MYRAVHSTIQYNAVRRVVQQYPCCGHHQRCRRILRCIRRYKHGNLCIGQRLLYNEDSVRKRGPCSHNGQPGYVCRLYHNTNERNRRRHMGEQFLCDSGCSWPGRLNRRQCPRHSYNQLHSSGLQRDGRGDSERPAGCDNRPEQRMRRADSNTIERNNRRYLEQRQHSSRHNRCVYGRSRRHQRRYHDDYLFTRFRLHHHKGIVGKCIANSHHRYTEHLRGCMHPTGQHAIRWHLEQRLHGGSYSITGRLTLRC